MYKLDTYRKSLTLVAVLVLSLGNSGIAAVVSSCSMEREGEMSCCSQDVCAMSAEGATAPALSGVTPSCFSTQVVGGLVSDEMTRASEMDVRPETVSLSNNLRIPIPGPDSFARNGGPGSLPSSAHPPDVYLKNHSFLI